MRKRVRAIAATLMGVLFLNGIARAQAAEETPAKTLAIKVFDQETGKPVHGAILSMRERGNPHDAKIPLKEDGTATLEDLPESEYFHLTASAPGYVPMVGWLTAATQLPPTLEIKLWKAEKVGGMVVDEAGTPVQGAQIELQVIGQGQGEQKLQFDMGNRSRATTDAAGLWTIQGIPEIADGVKIGVYSVLGANSDGVIPFKKVMDWISLKAGTAKWTVPMGKRVKGRVVDESGAPVRNAVLLLGRNPQFANMMPEIGVDAEGKFEIGCKPGADIVITALASGFAPELTQFIMPTGERELTLTLGPSQTISGQVLSDKGTGIQAFISISSWRGYETLNRQFATKPDGTFMWVDAPSDEVELEVGVQGGKMQTKMLKVKAGSPVEIRMLGRP